MIDTKEIAATLLLAGSVIFFTGAGGKVRADVTVNGVNVGGMPYAEAERAVREKIAESLAPLVISAPSGEYKFTYPELSFQDDVSALVRRAKKGARLEASIVRTWAAAEEELLKICEANARKEQNASLSFSEKGFVYTPERYGISCDYQKLLKDALLSLREGGTRVTLSCGEYAPEICEKDLRARTVLLSSFSTRFDGGNAPRAHNIALAAEKIAGTILAPGEEFSFNRVVGKRTAENGFREAAVIFEGQFVQGVGGGVCQASTTLFGAALRAGLNITESRPHSLSVGYVSPSLDAMVSEYSDLKFFNPYPYPVYLNARAGSGKVTFEIYGKSDGRTYRTESNVLFRVQPPPAQITEGETDRVIRAEKEGLASESYLLTYDSSGKLLSRALIRRDTYAVVQGIYERKPAEEKTEEPLSPLPKI